MQAASEAQIAVQRVSQYWHCSEARLHAEAAWSRFCLLAVASSVFKSPQAGPTSLGAFILSCSALAAEQCTAADPNGVGTVDRSKLKQVLTAPQMGLDQRQVNRPLQAEFEHALGYGQCWCAADIHGSAM